MNVTAKGPRKTPPVIDFHAHSMTQEVFDATYKLSVLGQLRADSGGAVRAFPTQQVERMTKLNLRLEEMDRMGVDIQVVSPNILHQCTYSLDPTEGLRLEKLNNDYMADLVSKAPDRLVGIASIPLQDVSAAIREMERAVLDLKLKGVVVASRVNDLELGDPGLRPFWKRAEDLQVPVFVHPAGNPDPRMRRHSLLISLGQPLEEAYAQTSLIYDGVLDECPNLKIAFAHGGGFIPYYAGRFDWIFRRGSTPQLKHDVSGYLQKFYYETVLFNIDVLDFLADKVDASKIMLGSDFPFGETHPVEFVMSSRKLSDETKADILSANAARFLNLSL
jgi:aminocarboxymuconate-semialdehyde decarboxylase